MSTNAWIGRRDEGRYLHSDGYPTHVLVVLGDLVREHGVDTVIEVVTTQDWSTLEGAKSKFYPWHHRQKNELVIGFGVAYKGERKAMELDLAAEYKWSYVLHKDHVEVLCDGEIQDVVLYTDITPALAQAIEKGR
jgi:hypothetical protein